MRAQRGGCGRARSGLDGVVGGPRRPVRVGDRPVVLLVVGGPFRIGDVEHHHRADPVRPVRLRVLHRLDQIVGLLLGRDGVPGVRRVRPGVGGPAHLHDRDLLAPSPFCSMILRMSSAWRKE